MFTWLNKQGVASSDGFTVQRMHRYFYHYVVEGDHIAKIIAEPCRDAKTGQYYEEIKESSFDQWLPPFETEAIPAEKIAQIKKNFSDALTFMDIVHRFV